jgi:hypothetical protein
MNREDTTRHLKELSERQDLTDWEKGFVSSVSKGLTRYGSLTDGQQGVLKKIVDKYSSENVERRASWKDSYTGEAKQDFMTMVDYYKANPPYYQDVIRSVALDENYAPSEKLWRSMCENKYAKRVLATSKADNLYPDGTLVTVRDTANTPGFLTRWRGKSALVISHPEGVRSAAKGSKRIVILPIGEATTVETEERWLKAEKCLPPRQGDYSESEEAA